MSVTPEANQLILDSAIAESIDNIDILAVFNESAEIHRIVPQKKETIASAERKYTFYLTENEAVDTIKKLALLGNGATVTPEDGTEMAYMNTNIVKTNTQSLLITWTVKVVA